MPRFYLVSRSLVESFIRVVEGVCDDGREIEWLFCASLDGLPLSAHSRGLSEQIVADSILDSEMKD
jgi:hypothetical protein